MHSVPVLDFGSQTAQLLVRRVRELGVYSELLPPNVDWATVQALQPCGIILSGSAASVYDPHAPTLPAWLPTSQIPVLGVCYGMQLQSHTQGGTVQPASEREFGPADITLTDDGAHSPLFADLPTTQRVWMSHADRIEAIPPGYTALATTANTPYAAMGNAAHGWYGVQFHPEVIHTTHGRELLRNFLVNICHCPTTWQPANFVAQAVQQVQERVAEQRVLCALSGGVDSAVAALIIHQAIGERLTCVFVDNGLLRLNEAEQVIRTFRETLHIPLIAVDAREEFLAALDGITDPEQKRKIIGEQFIHIFEREATGWPISRARFASSPKAHSTLM